jgi:hypothetical protein
MPSLFGSGLFTLVSFAFGICAVAYYLRKCSQSVPCEPEFLIASGFFLAGFGLPAAARLGYLAIALSDQELAPFTDDDRIIMFIGALAVVWMFYLFVKNFRQSL